MAPLAASAATMALPSPSPTPTAKTNGSATGVAFKLQSKSAVALVNERRIEFVRSKNHKSMATIDETTGQIVKDKKPSRDKDVLVAEGEIERHLQWRHAKKIGPGLANLGNTCYLNSVLQCLCYTPSFAQYLLQKDVLARFGATTSGPSPSPNQNQHGNKFHKSHGTMMGKSHVAGGGQGFCGARVMARLLQSVHGGTARVLQPKELVMNIRHVSKNFRIGRQEDSHEFFRLLLDAMQRASLRKAHIKQEHSPAAATTFIHRLFSGKLKNTLTCAKCQFVSERLDDFMDLSLEINHGITSIKGAIKHFTATETLDDSNAWKCSRCQQRSRAEKGMTIDTCPNVLVVQLKRFDAMFGKIKKHIEFSTTLDLSLGMAKGCADRTRGRNKYELHAVLVHAGFSTNCGHYYAFVKGSSGQWYEMNDETVRWVSVETVLQQKAYMLFYSRVLPPGEQPPPREKAAAKEKPAEKKKPSEEAAGEPVKPVAVNGTAAKPVEKLSMNGFLTSLRTDLDAPKKPVENGVKKPVENGVNVLVRPPTSSVVTYTVSVPVKHQGTRKRRLVPVFVGSVGRFARFQSSAKWTRAAPLEMTLLETSSKATAELPNGRKASTEEETAATPPPQRVVEKLAFNPRELRGFGEKNSALYGRSVDQWVAPEDAQGVQSVLVETHERVLQKLKQEDWTHRRAQRKSSWDDELDAGKTKKLKKRKAFVANEGKANAFQLALVQKKQKHA